MGKQKLTSDMIAQLYQLAKSVHFGKISMKKAKETAETLYKIHPGTAEGYFRNLSHLLAGEKYIRTMNEQATQYFLDHILIDFGIEAMRASLVSISKHKAYYENKATKERYLDRILKDYHFQL